MIQHCIGMMSFRLIAQSMGWIGTFSYILAYLLLSFNRLRSEQPLFHLLNIAGAAGLVCNAIVLSDYPSLIVNIVWGIIGIIAIITNVRKKGS